VSRAGASTAGEWLSGAAAVAARELAATFGSAVAYVATATAVGVANVVFMAGFFRRGALDMSGWFELLPLLLAVFLPAITMRSWAPERTAGTLELLLTLPLTPLQATAGKFAAALALLVLFLAGSLPIAAMLATLGSPDWGVVVSSYLGAALLGALLIAGGMLFSALAGDQVLAFVGGALLGAVLLASGQERVVELLDGWAPRLAAGSLLAEWISALPHYRAFLRGVVALPTLVYFAGMSTLLLWSTAWVLAHHRR
jgi:ABC-2 type transport system permease protein